MYNLYYYRIQYLWYKKMSVPRWNCDHSWWPWCYTVEILWLHTLGTSLGFWQQCCVPIWNNGICKLGLVLLFTKNLLVLLCNEFIGLKYTVYSCSNPNCSLTSIFLHLQILDFAFDRLGADGSRVWLKMDTSSLCFVRLFGALDFHCEGSFSNGGLFWSFFFPMIFECCWGHCLFSITSYTTQSIVYTD